jgi:integrase
MRLNHSYFPVQWFCIQIARFQTPAIAGRVPPAGNTRRRTKPLQNDPRLEMSHLTAVELLAAERIEDCFDRTLRSPHSRRAYTLALRAFAAWVEAERPSAPLTVELAQAYRRWFEAQPVGSQTGSGRVRSAASVNLFLTALRKYTDDLRRTGQLERIVAEDLRRERTQKGIGSTKGNWLSVAEARALLDAPLRAPAVHPRRAQRDRALLAFLLGCALRRGEVAWVQVDSFELVEARWVLRNLIGKGLRRRTVPVPAWVKVHVDAWVEAAGLTSGPLFRNMRKGGVVLDTPLADNAIWELVKTYSQQAFPEKKGGVAPHDLRRTCAHLCREEGGELEQIQALLGHSSIATTERYLGTVQKLARAVNDTWAL